jgi:uncharacterized protein
MCTSEQRMGLYSTKSSWRGKMNCPTCNVVLQMTERQGVEIDYCPKCRGVWLDRGELDRITERAVLERRPGGLEDHKK